MTCLIWMVCSMTWKISDVLWQARTVLMDTRGAEVTQRYTDQRLLDCYNIGVADAYRLRPDLFLPDLTIPPPRATTTDEDFPLDDQFMSGFIDYVVGYISMGDDEFVVEGRAQLLLNRFAQKLITKGA